MTQTVSGEETDELAEVGGAEAAGSPSAPALILPDVIFPVAQGAAVCELEVCTVCAPGDHRQFLVPAL